MSAVAVASLVDIGKAVSTLIDNRVVQYALILVVIIQSIAHKGTESGDKMTRVIGYIILVMFIILIYHDFQTYSLAGGFLPKLK